MLQKNPCTKRQSLGSSAHQNLRQDSVKVPGVKTLKWDVERSERKEQPFGSSIHLYPPVFVCIQYPWVLLSLSFEGTSLDFQRIIWPHFFITLPDSAFLLHVFCMSCFVPHRSFPKYRAIGAWCGTKPQSQTKPWTSCNILGFHWTQPSSTFQGQQQFTTPKNILLD